ncbi:MAG: hypothetical protein ABSF45_25360 [Terriglobia bacterium]|jgi:hypothetical protein
MPKPLSAVDCIGPAFAQTTHQLFAPFRFQRWARLALVCLILGDFAGGGGGPSGNFNLPAGRTRSGKGLLAIPNIDWDKILPWLPWVLAGVALLFLFIFLWVYVASVYRFVLFDSVLYDRCELKGSWGRWEPCGRSYFYWCLAIFVATAVGSCLIIGAPLLIAWRAGLFHHPREHLAALILGGAALFFILLAFFVLSAVVALFAKDFCVPIMAMEKVGVMDAWRRLLPMLAAEKLAFTGYVLMKIVLAIGSAIIFGIITFLTLLVLLIPLGIAAVIVFFAGKGLGLTLNVATISALVIICGIILAGIIYIVAFISTPAMVFFQSYVLHFMGSRYPALGAVVFPPPPETPPPPPVGEPPILEPSMG